MQNDTHIVTEGDEAREFVKKIASALDNIATSVHNIDKALQQDGQVDKRLRQLVSIIMQSQQAQVQNALSRPGVLDTVVMEVINQLRR